MTIQTAMLRSHILLAVCLLATQGHPLAAEPNVQALPSAQYGSWGVETDGLSASVLPGDNFYEYVNAGWLRTTDLPPGYALFSEPYAVQEKVIAEVSAMITGSADSYGMADSPERKRIRNLFQSYMASSANEDRGVAAIQPGLNRILGLRSPEDVAKWMANPSANSIFRLVVQPPIDMQGGYVLTVAQYRTTGLGLPGQIYYKSDQSPYPELRAAYLEYIAKTLARAGIDRPDERAREVLFLESNFASIMWSFAQLREAGASFRIVPTADLAKIAPGFPWAAYLEAKGLGDLDEINLGVGALEESAALFAQTPMEGFKSFLAFHWIDSHADLLSEDFAASRFDFYERRLFGVEDRLPRSERAIQFVQQYLGDDVGSLYAKKYLPSSHRENAREMIDYIRKAFRERLLQSEWMDDRTRAEAIAKLDAIIVEIGEPETGIDWSGLLIEPNDLVGNFDRLNAYRWSAQKARIGKPISRYGDWNMHPHRIGAGYHQQYNKIFITAGALLPPFFDPNADPAVNFGSIGQTIAHEFGHALDDQGSQFDRHGALRDWWSPASRLAYEKRTRALIEQFSGYEPVSNTPLKADQMIGEIVGDLVGTSIALRAYELFVNDHYTDGPPILDGFSGYQRFFLATAQQSRTMATEDALRDIANHESHPPAEFRVNGTLRNIDAWYRHFDVGPESEMYLSPDKRVTLW